MNDAAYKLSALQEQLIRSIEATDQMSLRFGNLQCVSAGESQRRGDMSFVFSADDSHSGEQVAVKFMDPAYLGNKYLLDAFEREASILEGLEGRERCLQIVSGCERFTWPVGSNADGRQILLSTGFFAVEWLGNDVDDYFLRQHEHDARTKLRIFRDILLATEAIHRYLVCHRDLKIDNIRIRSGEDRRVVVIIDFGMAARTDSPNLLPFYPMPKGAPAFSPPEAFAGFEGERDLGFHSDSYALGCLLFQLFNKSEFRYVRGNHTPYETITSVIRDQLLQAHDRAEREKLWALKMREFRNLVEPPPLDWDGNSVPLSAMQMINRTYRGLVRFDYRYRELDLAAVREWIDSAIRAFGNAQKQALEPERVNDFETRGTKYLTDWG